MNTEPQKGNGRPDSPDSPDKTRWLMRSSNGSEWETTGHYSREQVEAWELSKPVRPAFNG